MAAVRAAIAVTGKVRARSVSLRGCTSGAEHCASDSFPVHRYLAHRARVHDDHASRQGEYLIQVTRVQDDGSPGIPCGAESRMHVNGGEHVEPTGRILHHQTDGQTRSDWRGPSLQANLAPKHQLLLVSAGKGTHGCVV